MRKLQHLRQHLLDRVAGLAANPDRLLTFVQDGAIEFHRGQHLSHEYQVPAQLVLTDYSGELDEVMIPLLQWLSRYEPGLSPKDGLRFEAEILANNRWDLMLTVPLTERVVALVNCDEGRIDVEHRLPEYDIEPCPAEYWQLYVRRAEVDQSYELVAEWGDVPDE